MAQEPEDIEREFDYQREALGRNVQELQYRVRSMVNWRDRFAQNPFAAAGLAFAGGVLVSALVARGAGGGMGRQTVYEAPSTRTRRPNQFLDNMYGALVGVAANYAKEFLSTAVPGFRQEYDRRSRTDAWPGGATGPH